MTDRIILAAVAAVAISAGSARAEFILGLTNNNSLVGFDSATPGTVTASSQVFISGTAGSIVAIDRRPLTGDLYGLTAGGSLYIINSTTGQATLQSTLSVAAQIAASVVGGFDFNPAATLANALRIITSTDFNYRVPGANLTTGTTITDTSITPGTLDIVGSAYTNNFSGATTTTLYGLDALSNSLIVTASANDGAYTTVGTGLGVDIGSNTGFDISGLTGVAYASLDTPASGTGFYTVNLTTGAATLVGTVGVTLLDIAAPVVPAPVPATLPLALLGAASAVGLRRLRRPC